jgi:hypothetical protein
MNRSRLNPGPNGAQARIIWRDGPFRVECAGHGAAMKLCIYYGRFVMAEELVESAEAGWTRATEICKQLAAGDMEASDHPSV